MGYAIYYVCRLVRRVFVDDVIEQMEVGQLVFGWFLMLLWMFGTILMGFEYTTFKP